MCRPWLVGCLQAAQGVVLDVWTGELRVMSDTARLSYRVVVLVGALLEGLGGDGTSKGSVFEHLVPTYGQSQPTASREPARPTTRSTRGFVQPFERCLNTLF